MTDCSIMMDVATAETGETKVSEGGWLESREDGDVENIPFMSFTNEVNKFNGVCFFECAPVGNVDETGDADGVKGTALPELEERDGDEVDEDGSVEGWVISGLDPQEQSTE